MGSHTLGKDLGEAVIFHWQRKGKRKVSPSQTQKCMCRYTDIQTYRYIHTNRIHTYTHTDIHTHTYIQTYIQTYTDTHKNEKHQ